MTSSKLIFCIDVMTLDNFYKHYHGL